jgi:hypothetical protein
LNGGALAAQYRDEQRDMTPCEVAEYSGVQIDGRIAATFSSVNGAFVLVWIPINYK